MPKRYPSDFFHLAFLLFATEFVRGLIVLSFLVIYGENVLGMSLTWVGLAVTAHSLADLVSKSSAGFFLDRFPARVVLGVLMGISFLGLVLLPFARDAWLFILSATLFGFGISPVWLLAMGSVEEERRSAQMGILYAFWLLGTGSGVILSNFLIGRGSVTPLYVALGVWGVSLLSVAFLRDFRHPAYRPPLLREQFRVLVHQFGRIRALLPGMLFQTVAAGMLIPIIPNFLAVYQKLPYDAYSYLLLVGGGLALGGLIPMGIAADRLGRRGFLLVGFFLMGVALLFMATPQPLERLLFWAAVLGIGYAALLPAWNALLAQYVPPNHKGVGWGLFSTLEGLGLMLGSGLGGFLADRLTTPNVVLISGMMLLSLVFFYLFAPLHPPAFWDSSSDRVR
ncbi:MAG: multidrug resistance protein-related protein [Brockia lithotrophica]|uniref:Multidrug resistance protein-related protein n=1 Tax=Brockia lithotrophica TaxID=933949 RepID=A0A2T5G5K6_9BACL|nr:MFS transporter [Brockia lithotrophica]PTQ51466.1 MAG: multidrug resistance protein-related protein [Brockia lithotrophica]